MDAQDLAILAVLAREPRAPYGDVASRVGLSANAVKARLAGLRDEGVLQGFAVHPAPGVLGFHDGLLSFSNVDDAPGRDEDLLRGLPDVPGVRLVDVSVDHSVHVRIAWRDEADWDRIERAAISLVGKPPAYRHRGPEAPTLDLAANDRRVVHALLADGRASLKDVAARAGLSFKTAKRRLDHLLDEGIVRVEPILSPAEARKGVLSSTLLVLQEAATLHTLARALPPHVLLTGDPAGRLAVVHALHASLRDAAADTSLYAQAPGVERALASLSTRRHANAWLADALLSAAAPPAAAPRAPAPVPLPRG